MGLFLKTLEHMALGSHRAPTWEDEPELLFFFFWVGNVFIIEASLQVSVVSGTKKAAVVAS